MANLPSIELLESTHVFPGPYIFKAIGKTENAFVRRVLTAAREAVHSDVDPPFKARETKGGKHVCVTLTLVVEKAMEVHAIYSRILSVRGLVLLF